MEMVRNLALCFCAAAVFTGSVGLLSGKSLEKSMRYIIALILLCTVLSGAVELKKDLNFSFSYAGITKTESIEAASIFEAEYIISELLRQHTVNFEKVSVTSTKTGKDCIIINEICVKGADDRKKTEAALKSVGIDCRVVFG